MAQIMLDLDRTFYTHRMFIAKDGEGQQALFNVLAAYARFNPAIGLALKIIEIFNFHNLHVTCNFNVDHNSYQFFRTLTYNKED